MLVANKNGRMSLVPARRCNVRAQLRDPLTVLTLTWVFHIDLDEDESNSGVERVKLYLTEMIFSILLLVWTNLTLTNPTRASKG